jgi:hypothetical protein
VFECVQRTEIKEAIFRRVTPAPASAEVDNAFTQDAVDPTVFNDTGENVLNYEPNRKSGQDPQP